MITFVASVQLHYLLPKNVVKHDALIYPLQQIQAWEVNHFLVESPLPQKMRAFRRKLLFAKKKNHYYNIFLRSRISHTI
jgi:hypothetical protein